jgi:DNA topoisomerase-1
MELIVAEKPKVAEKIAAAIGTEIRQKRVGQVSYYEGEHDGTEFVVAPAVGHLYGLAEKKKTNSYPVFDIEWVPSYEESKGSDYTKKYLDVLQKLGKKADVFVSACDYDIEGSTIAYNIFRFATPIKDGRRMKFSALTSEDLAQAYADRGEFDYNNAYAGEARHILDWYYGINLSRALMSALRAAHRYRVMSIGRVQGPALDMVAELELRIRAFVPTPYWELTAEIKGAEFMHGKGRFTDESEAKAALDRTSSSGNVAAVEKKEQIIKPNPNFDLTSLQVEAHAMFNIPPSETLEIAQRLYEDSLISYPRTSSQQIPPSIKTKEIIKQLAANPEYKQLAEQLIKVGRSVPIQGKKTDPAHPAIHPLGQRGKIEGNEKRLYDLIVRRFLASCAPDAKKERTNVLVNAGSEPYEADGVVTIDPGWISFYGPYYKSEDKDLPKFAKDERVPVNDKQKTRKETKPPKRYTQASIISELERRHLGTKATRSNIIDTLFKRGYVDGKPIEVTDFGMKVREVLHKHAPEILDEALTRKIEDDMEQIQDGKLDKDVVIGEGKEILIQTLDRWKKEEAKIGEEILEALKVTMEKENLIGVCDKCGKQLRIIRMKTGSQFIGCTGYPACRNTYPLPQGALIKSADKPCPVCGKPTIQVIRKGRRRFEMCVDPGCPSKKDWGKPKTESEEKK